MKHKQQRTPPENRVESDQRVPPVAGVEHWLHADRFMVFDVASIGRCGGPFAVGWCVVDRRGGEMSHGYSAVPHYEVGGYEREFEWAVEKIVPHLPIPPRQRLREMFADFHSAWVKARDMGAVLAARDPFPAKHTFLSMYMASTYDQSDFVWVVPPVVDVSSVCFAVGLRLDRHLRTGQQLPEHNPLADARYAAALLHHSMRSALIVHAA